jgi:hypothetical protein
LSCRWHGGVPTLQAREKKFFSLAQGRTMRNNRL